VNSLRPILAGLVGAVIAALLLRWALRTRGAGSGEAQVRYGGRMRALSVLMLAIAIGIVYAALHASASQRMMAFLVAAPLLAGSVWFVLEAFVVKATVSATHLTHRSPWRGTRTIPWSTVTGYEFSPEMSCHVLRTSGHGKVRLSSYMSGVELVTDRVKNPRSDTEP
jgi:hypothetical protein